MRSRRHLTTTLRRVLVSLGIRSARVALQCAPATASIMNNSWLALPSKLSVRIRPTRRTSLFTNTRLDNPAGTAANPPSAAASTIRGMDTDWKTPYMQHWSLDVQHQVSSNMMFQIGYYGSKGTHLVGVTEINDLPPGLALNSFCAPGNNTTATPGVTLVRCQPAGYAFRNTATTVAQGNPNVVGTTRFYRQRDTRSASALTAAIAPSPCCNRATTRIITVSNSICSAGSQALHR